ncbi:hypothetical protein D9M69_667000 [compost metagenome]
MGHQRDDIRRVVQPPGFRLLENILERFGNRAGAVGQEEHEEDVDRHRRGKRGRFAGEGYVALVGGVGDLFLRRGLCFAVLILIVRHATGSLPTGFHKPALILRCL